MKQAMEMIEQGNLQGALEILKPLYDQNKTNAETNYLLGVIAIKQDRYDDALSFLTQAEKQNPDDARVYEAFGEAYGLKAQNAGMLKGAMLMPKIKKSFERALELNPGSLRANEGLFMFYLFVPSPAGGNEKKAVQIATEIASINEAHGYMAEALIKAKSGATEEAAVQFEQALQKAPQDKEVQMKAGRFMLQNGRLDLAEKAFKTVVSNNPFDPAGYDALGQFYLKDNNAEKALEQFNGALEKNPAFYPAKLNRAKAFSELGKTDDARSDLEEILKQHAKSPLAARAKELLAKL